MQTKTTYKGTLKGVYGIWCGFKPKGVKVEEEVLVYYPDEGKVFQKGKENFTCVVLAEGEKIEDYVEVEAPVEEQPKEQEEVPVEAPQAE